ncbi:hypothetical protein N8Z41_02765 [Amylibacter sp.]|nr:hypothetical protein [Amylibacter sp.]
MKKRQIIFWAGVDWLHLKQSQQYLAENFSNMGYECIYLQPIVNRKIKLSDTLIIIKRFINLVRNKGSHKNSLEVITPLVLSSHNLFGKIVNRVFIPIFIYRIRKKTDKNAVHYIWWPTPEVDLLLNRINALNIIYNLVDFHHSSLTDGASLVQSEDNIAKKSSAIICTSKELVKYAQKWREKPTYQRDRGLDLTLYKIADKSHITTPIRILGYYGGLSKRIDFNLIYELAENGYKIHLAGPLNKVSIPYHDNIIYFGVLEPVDIPQFMKNIDCTLWPYLKNNYTDAILPAKTRECLSVGKPIFSRNLASIVEENVNGIFVYADLHELLMLINSFKATDFEKLYKSEILAYVKQGTWPKIAQDEARNILKAGNS